MKKSWIYFVLVLLLGGFTWYYFHREENPTYPLSEANFNVKDTNAIETIFLSNMKKENVKISRTQEGWILNDSLDVRTDALSGLLRVLNKQYAEKPVPSGYHDDVIRELSATGTKIELYTKQGKTHCFYVSQIPGPNNLTYMLNEGAKRPYIVKLPLENNFVGIRYFTGEAQWRSKHILYSKHAVNSVSVQYPDSSQYSFAMKVTPPDSFYVETNHPEHSLLNKKRVRSYLGFLEKVYCTGFESVYGYKDSVITKGKQMATLTVQREGKAAESITFYFKKAGRDTKGKLVLNGVEYDGDYFFGFLNHRDLIVMNRNATQTLLRRGKEFFEADQE
ncbi:MAG: hypothetical protein JNM95_08405 [Chitinophagaceae bacterium]|nr:hypothetical protein [Chitinophagaceae bacterium]